MAGLAYFMGAGELGCGVIRVGNGIPELQWDTIRRIGPTGCIVVPSFLIKLVGYAQEHGIDYRRSSLRRAICIGGRCATPTSATTRWERKSPNCGPNWSSSRHTPRPRCRPRSPNAGTTAAGMFRPTCFWWSCSTSRTTPVPEGQEGEVVITTLGVRGHAAAALKTATSASPARDAVPAAARRCASSVIGRRGQMIKFKGHDALPARAVRRAGEHPRREQLHHRGIHRKPRHRPDRAANRQHARDEAFEKKCDTFRSKVRVAPEVVFEPVEYIAKNRCPK